MPERVLGARAEMPERVLGARAETLGARAETPERVLENQNAFWARVLAFQNAFNWSRIVAHSACHTFHQERVPAFLRARSERILAY